MPGQKPGIVRFGVLMVGALSPRTRNCYVLATAGSNGCDSVTGAQRLRADRSIR